MKKRSVKIAGHPTSITLEDEFWNALKDIAAAQDMTIAQLITQIDETRGEANLSSALRVYILQRAQRAAKA